MLDAKASRRTCSSVVGLCAWLSFCAGCVNTNFAFECKIDQECVDGQVQGTCEPGGLCSFADGSCPAKRRYGRFAGGRSDQCVACGDGTRDPGEECDDGNDKNDDGCLTSCRWATCGDGFVRAAVEECD